MIIRLTHPLISCICITDNRPSLLLKAIVCFDTQNYPNRELVISYPETDHVTRDLVQKIMESSDLRIVPITRSAEISIGKARNEAVAKCNGEFICTWDDDDWYHSYRLAHSHNLMLDKANYCKASVYTTITLFDSITNMAYKSSVKNWSGTLLCQKELVLRVPFSDCDYEEATTLINYFESNKLLFKIPDCHYLYMHLIHNKNITPYDSFQKIVQDGQPVSNIDRYYISRLVARKVDLI